MARPIPKALTAKMARVKLFLCDVDGVLTNATVFIGDGREFKEFHIRDGLGLRLLQQAGIKVGWISNRPSTATQQRADELKVDFLYQAKGSKVEAVEAILKRAGLDWDDVCYMGDDVVDLGALKRAGLAIGVPSAIDEVKDLADYVTRAEGGQGAVREAVGLILKAQNKWQPLVLEYSA